MDASQRHVVIIGAGIVGAASALEALRRGFKVTLLDPGSPGGEQAASYGNSGWLSSHSVLPPALPGLWKQVPGFLRDPLGPLAVRWEHAPRAAPWLLRYLLSGWTWERVERTATALRTLLADAPRLHQQLAREAGVAELILHCGLLHVFRSRAEFDAEGEAWALRRRLGIGWTELGPDALHEREPDLDERYRFAVFVAEAGRCANPGRYTAALVKHATALGASVVADTATGFNIDGDQHLRAVRTGAGEIACDAAVICAGAYSKPLAAQLGDRVPLQTERGYHVLISGLNAGPRNSMMVSDAKMVVNPMEQGVRAAGQVEIASLEATPNWERARILQHSLQGMFPNAAKPSETQVKLWMGHRPSLPDGLPCIGHARVTRDVVYAFGHGHVGLVGSARTGRLVGQLLASEELEIPLGPFNTRRF